MHFFHSQSPMPDYTFPFSQKITGPSFLFEYLGVFKYITCIPLSCLTMIEMHKKEKQIILKNEFIH